MKKGRIYQEKGHEMECVLLKDKAGDMVVKKQGA